MTELPKLRALVAALKRYRFYGRLLAVDPGETTGYCVLDVTHESIKLLIQGQILAWPIERSITHLTHIFTTQLPTEVVYEAYHIYSWRLEEHRFSEVPTIQIIGCLKTLAFQRGLRVSHQTAQVGKSFFKDEMLRRVDMYYEGQPHARDSLRHALQFITFGPPKHQNDQTPEE